MLGEVREGLSPNLSPTLDRRRKNRQTGRQASASEVARWLVRGLDGVRQLDSDPTPGGSAADQTAPRLDEATTAPQADQPSATSATTAHATEALDLRQKA